jgi:hypothetical protein
MRCRPGKVNQKHPDAAIYGEPPCFPIAQSPPLGGSEAPSLRGMTRKEESNQNIGIRLQFFAIIM